MTVRHFACICLFGASATSGIAQHPAAAERRMTLDVVVADKSGRPVPGLRAQDFTLLENKQPREVLSFAPASPGQPPVEAILLLDELNASAEHMAVGREEIDKFLRTSGDELPCPVSVAFLTDSGITVANDPSTHGKAIADILSRKGAVLRAMTKSSAVWGAGDRTRASLAGLQELASATASSPGRKLVIWISPGWPLLSGPDIELTSQNRQQAFNAIVGASDKLRWSRITLYAIDPLGTSDATGYRTWEYRVFLKPVRKWQQAQLGDLALQVIANQTGGLALNSSNDVAGEIARCMTDVRAFYVLSFNSLPGNAPSDFHSLEAKIDKPGLTARMRIGYYAQP